MPNGPWFAENIFLGGNVGAGIGLDPYPSAP
jgi:hypothetical protein